MDIDMTITIAGAKTPNLGTKRYDPITIPIKNTIFDTRIYDGFRAT